MQQDEQRPLAGLDVMQPLIADLGVALTKVAGQAIARDDRGPAWITGVDGPAGERVGEPG